eukprot:TRINITY_DN45892_c0_g1_i1.p1 TRINITY_DN45892_c0_g1~~TRINITY_DN45892_c0_g1_i1.p1  ORF type:complete len:299 (-),score=41.35 TRINITY_DN45892_c0_g1_i1:118-1014(-)
MAADNHSASSHRWNPNGIIPLRAPPPRTNVDHRWRSPRTEEEPIDDKSARAAKAVENQRAYASFPGYAGHKPAAPRSSPDASESRNAATPRQNLHTPRQRDATPRHSCGTPRREALEGSGVAASTGEAACNRRQEFPDEHPLGRSRAATLRNYWVPTIPGYSGYIPGKYAENICGGGMTQTCKMAGRAIASQSAMSEGPPPVTAQDCKDRNRIVEFYHDAKHSEANAAERVRVATMVREHCLRPTLGYKGHIPRVKGESLFGTTKAVSRLAADFVDDRIMNPDGHHEMCLNAQPLPRE